MVDYTTIRTILQKIERKFLLTHRVAGLLRYIRLQMAISGRVTIIGVATSLSASGMVYIQMSRVDAPFYHYRQTTYQELSLHA